MNKILEFGRKAMFYVRVLSGYEERRIRNFRLQVEKRLQKAQERKAALSKLPEQAILSEVRRMVDEMQNLNKKLEETETAIEEYFKPIDKQAEIIMKTQLEGEEKTMRQMAEALQSEAALKLQKSQEGKATNEQIPEAHQQNKETESTTQQHGRMR